MPDAAELAKKAKLAELGAPDLDYEADPPALPQDGPEHKDSSVAGNPSVPAPIGSRDTDQGSDDATTDQERLGDDQRSPGVVGSVDRRRGRTTTGRERSAGRAAPRPRTGEGAGTEVARLSATAPERELRERAGSVRPVDGAGAVGTRRRQRGRCRLFAQSPQGPFFSLGAERVSELTAEEFERRYAEQSGVSVARLRAMGRVVRPCDCGAEGYCEGWQMVSKEYAAEIDDPAKPWAR